MNLYDVLAGQGTTHFERLFSRWFAGGGKKQTLTGQPPLSFKADGTPLISWSMKGNGQQTGTPTHDAPIMPDFVGTLSGSDWTIPITCAGQMQTVYLGQVSTVRRVKKLVFDGTENWAAHASWANVYTLNEITDYLHAASPAPLCSHYQTQITASAGSVADKRVALYYNQGQLSTSVLYIKDTGIATVSDLKTYLAAQYAAGTPVTVWYVLATPETGIVNEPLCKIGDYADELSSTDVAVTIPTAKGQNTLTVETDLQPSEMTITYKV